MATIESLDPDEDWGQTMDDWDAGDWEDIFRDGDDYGAWETQDCGSHSVYDDPLYVEELGAVEESEAGLSEIDAYEQQAEAADPNNCARIVKWLASTDMARGLPDAPGFHVLAGFKVRLLGGEVLDLFDWLRSEGIRDGDAVGDYRVECSFESGAEWERIRFFKSYSQLPLDCPKASKTLRGTKLTNLRLAMTTLRTTFHFDE